MTIGPLSQKHIIGLFVISLVLYFFNSRAANDDHQPLSWECLATAMQPVKCWTSTDHYTSNDWSKLVDAAKLFQQSDPTSVEKTLKDWEANQIKNCSCDYLTGTKLMLTLKMVFDLPEKIQASEPHPYSIASRDGTFNLAWPFAWNEGRPKFIAKAPDSYNGCVFPASSLFHWYREKYKFRDLSKFYRI